MSCVIGEVCLLLPSSCVTCRCVDSTMAFVSWNLLSSSVALLINSHTVEYGCRTCPMWYVGMECFLSVSPIRFKSSLVAVSFGFKRYFLVFFWLFISKSQNMLASSMSTPSPLRCDICFGERVSIGCFSLPIGNLFRSRCCTMFVGVHGSKDSMLVLNPQHGFHVGRGFFVLFVFVSIMFFVCYLTFNAAKVANKFDMTKF